MSLFHILNSEITKKIGISCRAMPCHAWHMLCVTLLLCGPFSRIYNDVYILTMIRDIDAWVYADILTIFDWAQLKAKLGDTVIIRCA